MRTDAKSQRNKTTSEAKKRAVEAMKSLYLSLSPEYLAKGLEVVRMLGVPEENIAQIASLESFLTAAMEADDLNLEDIEKGLAWAKQVQRDPGRCFKPAIKDALRQMPRLRGSGRTPLIKTEEERKKLRDEVSQLINESQSGIEPLGRNKALDIVGRRNGVSLRTMHRICPSTKSRRKKAAAGQ